MKVKITLLFSILFLAGSNLSAQFDLESDLTDAEKLYGLSKFWSEATYNFAFFDQTEVDWDSAYQSFIPRVLATPNTFEYYRELKRFCALLNDGHTDVWAPNSLYVEGVFIRLIFQRLGDQIVVSNVAKSEAQKVPIGSVLIQVDGQPADAFFEEQIMPYISASTEHERWSEALRRYGYPLRDTVQTQEMLLVRPDGSQITYTSRYHNQNTEFMFAGEEWQRFSFNMLEGDIAHVEINTFGDQEVVSDFEAILPQLLEAKGVILDLRANGGGNSDTGAAILQYFTDKDLYGSTWRTREHKAAYKAWGDWLVEEEFDDLEDWPEEDQQWYHTSVQTATGNSWHIGDTMFFENTYEGDRIETPLVVLISNNTASAAEDFLIFLDGLDGRATVVGQRSFGSTGQPLVLDLPGGGGARICSKRDTYPDGREFVGYGVEPDIFIEYTIDDLIHNRDLELEKAQALIKE